MEDKRKRGALGRCLVEGWTNIGYLADWEHSDRRVGEHTAEEEDVVVVVVVGEAVLQFGPKSLGPLQGQSGYKTFLIGSRLRKDKLAKLVI